MTITYTSNTFLQVQNSSLYGIFAWSQRAAQVIATKSWLMALEIFVDPTSLLDAYDRFQAAKKVIIEDTTKVELAPYKTILETETGILLVADQTITLFGRGFRSFIEKSDQFQLSSFSHHSHPILPYLFSHIPLEDDLETITTVNDFKELVEQLAEIGFLSPAKGTIHWGDLKKTAPICQAFGLTRGTPVDRYYLSQFIHEVGSQVYGNILEIGGTPKDKDFYEFSSHCSYRILNLEPGPGVDICGDVHDASVLDPNSIDSILIFNVLEHCYAPWKAIENIHTWLKPGGKCFAMVPNAIRLHATPMDYWRPLPDAFKWMFQCFSEYQLFIYGNPITVIASYHGIAVEELTVSELNAFHPDYPVATCIVARK